MSLRELYQQLIVDHGRNPRNFGTCDDPCMHRDGVNPLCGDQLHLTMRMDGDRIESIRFTGEGCAISMASASLMTECLKGKTMDEAKQLFDAFHALLTTDEEADEALGKCVVFSGVREFPMRVKCATLAWHTLRAMWNEDAPITTED